MKIGIYSDPHITRKVSYLPDRSENIISTFREIYDIFYQNDVDEIVCAGDFFDRARIQSEDTELLFTVVNDIMTRGKVTCVLSGNHDRGNATHSLVRLLGLSKDIIPVKDTYFDEDTHILYIPYGCEVDWESQDLRFVDMIVSHDEYAGMVINSLGVLSQSKNNVPDRIKVPVFNGHIHRPSTLNNIINLGTVLPTKFGEYALGEVPSVYIYDTEDKKVEIIPLVSPNLMYIITPDMSTDLEQVLSSLSAVHSSNLHLRVDYIEDTTVTLWKSIDSDVLDRVGVKSVQYRKVLPESATVLSSDVSIDKGTQKIDVVDFIKNRVNNDETLDDQSRSGILKEVESSLIEEV